MSKLEDDKVVIAAFLKKCNAYAQMKVNDYQTRLNTSSTMEHMELQEKITRWTTYIAFNDYSLERLDGSELDAWLEAGDETCRCGG